MDLDNLVKSNKEIIAFVNNWPGRSQPFHIKKNLLLTPYIGTLDIATARFNSILLRLSEHKLLQKQFQPDVIECQKTIKKFYKNTLRLKTFPKFFIPFFKWRLHRLGIRKIPKIKATYKSLLITIDD